MDFYDEAVQFFNERDERRASKAKAIFSVAEPGTPRNEDGSTKRNVVAFEGEVRVVCEGDDFFGSGKTFRDRILKNPTWGNLLSAATRQIRATADLHHTFLESAEVVGEEQVDGRTIKLVRLWMGS
jgi:hypothetical protein